MDSRSGPRNYADDARALSRRRLDRQLAAYGGKTVVHVRQSSARTGASGREPYAVVPDGETDRAVVLERDRDGARAGGVLLGILECLEAAEVDGAFELGRIAADAVALDGRRYRSPPRDGPKCLSDTAIREERWVDASRERPDLVDCLLDLRSERAHVLGAAHEGPDL